MTVVTLHVYKFFFVVLHGVGHALGCVQARDRCEGGVFTAQHVCVRTILASAILGLLLLMFTSRIVCHSYTTDMVLCVLAVFVCCRLQPACQASWCQPTRGHQRCNEPGSGGNRWGDVPCHAVLWFAGRNGRVWVPVRHACMFERGSQIVCMLGVFLSTGAHQGDLGS
jgi:hypothetical protein